MDTSEEYTKMCEKARKEIQEQWIPKLSDVVAVKWKEGSRTGGLQGAIVQDRPAYGIGYEHVFNKTNQTHNWFCYNGAIRGKQCKDRLIDNVDFEMVVWLPRQDQLQDMIKFHLDKRGGRQTTDYSILVDLHNMSGDLFVKTSHSYEFSWSMEMLWFNHAMKLIHNKVWNGEDWVVT